MLQAQISPLSDQFLINPFLTNPALAGTTRKAPLNITARQQWLGMKGAPTWQSATWNSCIINRKAYYTPRGFVNKGENSFGNVGIGGGLFNVKYGAISQIGLHFDYAYHVYLGNGRLSFGLAPVYYQFIIDKSGFLPPDNGPDPLIDGDVKEILHKIDFNAGLHFFSDFAFAGFSAVQMFNSAITFGKLSFTSESEKNSYLARSLYLYGGITPMLNKNVSLEPSVLIKYNDISSLSYQLNLRTTIYENFQAGLFYHFMESAGFMAGICIKDLVFRYQFELPLGNAVLTRFSSHQIMVGYLL